MKKIFWLIIFIIISNLNTFSQNNIIRITKTQIITPDTILLDTLNPGDQTYIKLIIKNERQNSVIIKNIKTPPGTGASINNHTLKPKSQTELFIGFDTHWMNVTGNFVYKVTLETNLIKNIDIYIKGYVNPD